MSIIVQSEFLLYFGYHASGIEISVVFRQLFECMQVFVERLHDASSRHRVAIPVDVLGIVAIGRKMAPKDVDRDAEI